MMDFIEKNQCRGCSACKAICLQDAISLISDDEGFLYPKIDNKLCVSCGMCQSVCPAFNKNQSRAEPLKYYALKSKDLSERRKSSSGGASFVLAKEILNQNGIVIGAAFDESFKVHHVAIDSLCDYEKIQGSKYVQSEITDIYPLIKKYIEENRKILFVGTPCQCDGIKQFVSLNKLNDNLLILCDVVCHGVPSPMIWSDYLNLINTQHKLKKYLFRDKNIGWHGDNIRAEYTDKTKINTAKLKVFTKLYFSNLISRPCCSSCEYTSFHRVSDITIGDFWGIEKINPSFSDSFGVSLVMVNSVKGEELFSAISNEADVLECKKEDCKQEQLVHPTPMAHNRVDFWNDYKNCEFKYIAKRYGGLTLQNAIRLKIKKTLKQVLKRLK